VLVAAGAVELSQEEQAERVVEELVQLVPEQPLAQLILVAVVVALSMEVETALLAVLVLSLFVLHAP
jgi:hypothetical protein